jgi:hypothetical protein
MCTAVNNATTMTSKSRSLPVLGKIIVICAKIIFAAGHHFYSLTQCSKVLIKCFQTWTGQSFVSTISNLRQTSRIMAKSVQRLI